MRIKLTHDFFLTLCAICLATLCVLSIINPLLFEGQRAKREEVVKKRLIAIRSAEEKYKILYRGIQGTCEKRFSC